MSSRSKVTHAIQVFPFLAVLVCTMGALIFLLLLMTRQVRKREDAFAANERVQRALANAAAVVMPSNSAPEPEPVPEPDPAPRLFVFPQQPAREQKPVKLPDQAYTLALAEREREQHELTTKWKLKTRQLKTDREQKHKSLAHFKSLVDDALKQTSAIQADVEDLSDQLEQFTSDVDVSMTSAEERAEQRQIEKQIAEMKKRLRAAQAAEENGDNEKFQVVPFDPQSGTTRRPILLECTAEGIRFLPEGILITPADLHGFTPRANPLAAGTGALINYWNEWKSKQKNPKSQPDPYPLLLVRPDGVVAYYVAIKMLEPIKTNHGYELIEESTSLQLPEMDPGAKAACETAVQRLLSERENIRRIAVNSGAGSTVFGGGSRGARGDGGTSGGGGRGTGGAGAGTGRGRGGAGGGSAPRGGGGSSGEALNGEGRVFGSGGFGSGDPDAHASGNGSSGQRAAGRPAGDNQFSVDDLESGEEEVGNRSWERIEKFEGRPPSRRGDEVASGNDGGQGGAARRGGTAGGGNKRIFGFRTGAAGTADGDGSDSSEGDTDGSDSAGTRSTGGKKPEKGSARSGASGTNSPSTGSSTGDSGGSSPGVNAAGEHDGVSGDPDGGDGSGGSATGNANSSRRRGNVPMSSQERWSSNGDTPKSNASQDNPGGSVETEPGMPIGKRPGSKHSRAKQMSGEPGDGSEDGQATDDPSGTEAGSDSRPGGRSNRFALSENGSSAQRTSRGSRSSTNSRQADRRDKSDDPNRKIEPEMLAGRHWGYSEAGASIGFEREVRVDVSPDKLVIGERHEVPIGQGETTQETFELFVMALDRCSHEWGRPPQGFFWTPRLKFIVKPDATGRYEQVNELMSRAGISTSQEFAKTTNSIEFGRDPQLSKKPVPKSARKFSSGGKQ